MRLCHRKTSSCNLLHPTATQVPIAGDNVRHSHNRRTKQIQNLSPPVFLWFSVFSAAPQRLSLPQPNTSPARGPAYILRGTCNPTIIMHIPTLIPTYIAHARAVHATGPQATTTRVYNAAPPSSPTQLRPTPRTQLQLHTATNRSRAQTPRVQPTGATAPAIQSYPTATTQPYSSTAETPKLIDNTPVSLSHPRHSVRVCRTP